MGSADFKVSVFFSSVVEEPEPHHFGEAGKFMAFIKNILTHKKSPPFYSETK
jgi:hypothetical protein